MDCSVSTQKQPGLRYLHAADVRYHLDFWLVCVCLPGASVSDMHACMHKFTDMTFG